MLNALAEVGSTAKTSGVELDELTGYITALTVATGKSGSEVGTAIRSIMTKIYKGDSIKALKEINVQVKDAEGNFRDFTSIINDLDKVWGNLSRTQIIQTATKVGGIERYNDFISLVSNLDTAMEASTTAANSFNSAINENEIYLESIEGRMSSLSATAQGFWFNLINSDTIKGGILLLELVIKGLDGMQQTFGGVATAIGVVSSSILMFTNNPLKELAKGIATNGFKGKEFQTILNKVKYEMSGASTVSEKATTSMKLLGGAFSSTGVKAALLTAKTVALNAVMSVGLSVAISGVISLITKLADSMITTKSEWKEITDECSNNIDKNNELISSVETLMAKENELNSELQSGKLNSEEQAKAREELLDIQKQIAQLLPESSTGFTSEGEAISANTDKVLENLDAKKKLSEAEAIKMIGAVDLYDSDVAAKKYAEEQKRYEELMEAYKNGEQWRGVDVTDKMIEKSEKKINKYKEAIETDMKIIETLRNSGWTDEQIASKIYDYTSLEESIAMLGRTEKAWGLMTQAINENTDAKNENNNAQPITEDSALEEIQVKIDDAEISTKSATGIMNKFTEAIQEGVAPAEALADALNSIEVESNMKDATKAYSDSISEMVKLQDLIKDINEEGKLTPNIISSITSSYPEIGSAILDTGDTIDFLNGKIQEQEQIYTQALEIMVADDDKWYANHIANNSDMQNKLRELYNTFISDGADAYDIDLSNYQTLTQLKNALNDDLIDGLADYLKSYVGGNADTYKTDLRMKMRLYTVMYIENCLNC